jgi:N-acetylneuraminic acid mutarotase
VDETLRNMPMPVVAGNHTRGERCRVDALDLSRMAWLTLPRTQLVRHNPAICSARGKVFAFGGSNGDELNTVEIFEPTRKSWRPAAPMQSARQGCQACSLDDGTVVVIGGFDGTEAVPNVEAYHPESNSWKVLQRMATARTSFAAGLLPGNQIMVAGGFGDGRALASAEIYDVWSDLWSTLPSMQTERNGCAGCTTPAGVFIVAGGLGKGCPMRSCEAFDRRSNSWKTMPSMQVDRFNLALSCVGRTVFAIGDEDATKIGQHRSVDVFDCEKGAWHGSTPAMGRSYERPIDATRSSNIAHTGERPSV